MGTMFERAYADAPEVQSVDEFDAAPGYGHSLWRAADGRTLLMTGVVSRRVPRAVLDAVLPRFQKDEQSPEEGIVLYAGIIGRTTP